MRETLNRDLQGMTLQQRSNALFYFLHAMPVRSRLTEAEVLEALRKGMEYARTPQVAPVIRPEDYNQTRDHG